MSNADLREMTFAPFFMHKYHTSSKYSLWDVRGHYQPMDHFWFPKEPLSAQFLK